MTKIKLVVFDVDGTMLNTFEHIVRAFEVVLPQHNVKADREVIRKVIGKTLIDCYKELAPNADHEAMTKLHHDTQQTKEMYDLIAAYDGLRESLEGLHSIGVKTAIQTNRSRESIDLIFDHVGISGLFDEIVTPDSVMHPKPDPEGLLIISKRLSISPDSVVMVGDTPIDILAGKNAGTITIGVTHGFGTREELKVSNPDHIVDSLSEVERVIKESNGV